MLPRLHEGARPGPPRQRRAAPLQPARPGRHRLLREGPGGAGSSAAGAEPLRRVHGAPDGRLQDGQRPVAVGGEPRAAAPLRREPVRRRRKRVPHRPGREPDGVDLRGELLGRAARPLGAGQGVSEEMDERTVPGGAPRDRLDRALARLFGVSRGRAMEWIGEDRVRVDGRRAAKGAQVGPGARVSVRRPPPDAPAPQPELPLRIVHADGQVVVADKPAGMPSHPLKPGETGTAANALVGRFPELASVGPAPREGGLVHRLDTDTSGLLLAARTVEKGYLALVAGELHAGGEIDVPLAHDPHDARKVRAASDPEWAEAHEARPASTRFTPALRRAGFTLVD